MRRALRATRSPSLDSKPVVIVGGGLSGLAAAVELTSHNIPVLLLEQKPKLGGRAYSFVDATTGEVIDNGQHVLIAGYEHTMRFLEKIGTANLLNIQSRPSLLFHHPQRGFSEFSLHKLPSPFHLVAGIVTTNLFSVSDKLRLVRAGVGIQFPANDPEFDEMTIDEWLNAFGQSAEVKVSFWIPLAISIMNESITQASAKIFVQALHRAFLGNWRNSSLAIPRVGLSQLYVDDAVKFINKHGGTVRPNVEVVGLQHESACVYGVRCKDGSEVPCRAVILAVPHYEIAHLIPTQFSFAPSLADVKSTPIVSIHLWFADDFMAHEVVGVVGRSIQWVFNKRKTNLETRTGGHVSCVISGAGEFVDFTNAELVRIALNDIRSMYPSASALTHSAVIREKRATFSCTPASERLRPENRTGIPNMFVAGDWTNTGLPATIEGAILSGVRSATLVLNA